MKIGATVLDEGVRFRVWAPKCRSAEVLIEGEHYPLAPEEDGYFSGVGLRAQAGDLYLYQLDGKKGYPVPASRFQPEGPHGRSLVVDPRRFVWHDCAWPGVRMPGQVIYELHVGTFTPEGTFDAAARELAELHRFGVTLIEIIGVQRPLLHRSLCH